MADYSAEAVDRQIQADRRRHRVSNREAGRIHALLKGSTGYAARKAARDGSPS